jgi:hypothetical protein
MGSAGSSAHQQLPSGRQVIGESHRAQRVSTGLIMARIPAKSMCFPLINPRSRLGICGRFRYEEFIARNSSRLKISQRIHRLSNDQFACLLAGGQEVKNMARRAVSCG